MSQRIVCRPGDERSQDDRGGPVFVLYTPPLLAAPCDKGRWSGQLGGGDKTLQAAALDGRAAPRNL